MGQKEETRDSATVALRRQIHTPKLAVTVAARPVTICRHSVRDVIGLKGAWLMPKILLHFDLRCRPPWGQVDFVLHFCRSDPALEIFMIHDRHILVANVA